MAKFELDQTKQVEQILEIRQFGRTVGYNIHHALSKLNKIAIETKKKDIKIEAIIEDLHGNVDLVYSWLIDIIA